MAGAIQKDWVEFYLGVREFQETVVGDARLWELAGYETWGEFERELLKVLGESRATFYVKLRTVKLFPAETIRELGKTKTYLAARLYKAGLWNGEWQVKVRESDCEKLRREIKAACSQREEGRHRMTFLLVKSQWDLVQAQLERVKRLLGVGSNEAALDFIFAQVVTMADQEIQKAND